MKSFSNTCQSIHAAVELSKLDIPSKSLPELGAKRDDLRSCILDPLVTENALPETYFRSAHAEIFKARQTLIELQIKIVKTL